jgi:hypothetical protein
LLRPALFNHLPCPSALSAGDIVADLESALEQFAAIEEGLKEQTTMPNNRMFQEKPLKEKAGDYHGGCGHSRVKLNSERGAHELVAK